MIEEAVDLETETVDLEVEGGEGEMTSTPGIHSEKSLSG